MEKLVEWILDNGEYKAIIIFLVVLMIVLLKYTENIMILKSWIYGLFAKTYAFAKKKQISNKVQGTISKAIKSQSVTNNDIIPQNLKVVWIEEETPDTFIENNQVIVRIKQHSNPNENLVTAVSEYVNNGLLHNVKRYLNREVIIASNILMTRKIIQDASKTSLAYLDEHYISPKFKDDDELHELYSDLVKIDQNGMFIGILLNEFNKAGMSIYGDIRDPELVAESKEFMRFLHKIACKISNEPSDLCFNRDYFKVSIFLTASNRTLKKYGIEVFKKAIINYLDNGIETIYIFGLGKKREIAEQISNEVDSDFRISNITCHHYKHINENGRRVPGVFYECEIYKDN